MTLKYLNHTRALLRCAVPLGSLAVLAAASQAAAQDAAPEAQAAPAQGVEEGGSGDILVTARRKVERIQDVPVSITAFSQQQLEKNNIQGFESLQFQTPAMSVQAASTSRDLLQFTIRGQGAITLGAQAGVVVYLNEIPIVTGGDGYINGGPGLFYDLESLEVLKGPQGTLFGRNTTGGAVLLTTARPKNEFGGRIQVGYGNYNNREFDGMLNVPIVDEKVLVRVAVNVQKRDGITHILSTPSKPNGVDIDNRNTLSGRFSLLLRPTDWIENLTVASYQRSRSRGSSIFILDADPNGILAKFLVPGIIAERDQQRRLGARTRIPSSIDFDGVYNNLLSVSNATRFDLADDVAIRSILGYQRLTGDLANFENDGSGFRIFDLPKGAGETRQLTGELQLQGKALDKRLDYTLGVFHLTQRPTEDQPDGGIGRFSLLVQDFTALGAGLVTTYNQSYRKSTGIYGQASYEVVDGLRLTAGARYTWDDSKFVSKFATFTAPAVTQLSPSEAFTWNLGADYKINPDVLAYLAVRRGYRPGGSTRLATGEFQFGPEYVTDYELGLKAEWHHAGVSGLFNVALWRQDYTDIQLNRAVTIMVNGAPVGASVTDNAGEAKLWGIDIDASANLTDRLTIGGFYSHLNLNFGKFKTGVDTTQLLGNEYIGRVPNMFQVRADYKLPVPEEVGEMSIGANYSWHDKSRGFVFSSPAFIIPSVGLINLNFDWKHVMNSAFDISAFVSNLTNKTYVSGGESYLNLDKGTYGDPRFFGFRVKYHFGDR